MITNTMVEHINEKLNSLTKNKNPNFGVNEPAAEAPESGILVVLTKDKNMESFTSYDEILASSTVLGTSNDIFTVEGKTIKVINIPYSETVSINKGTATGFAIVKVESANLIQADITGSDVEVTPYKKYIINATSAATDDVVNYKILFSGALNTDQPIEENNSFSLSNIKITFN